MRRPSPCKYAEGIDGFQPSFPGGHPKALMAKGPFTHAADGVPGPFAVGSPGAAWLPRQQYGRLTRSRGNRASLPYTAGRRLAGPDGGCSGPGGEGLAGRVVRRVADSDLAVGLDDDRLDGFIAVDGGGQGSAAVKAGIQGPSGLTPARPKRLVLRKYPSADHVLPVGLDGHRAGAVPRLVQAGSTPVVEAGPGVRSGTGPAIPRCAIGRGGLYGWAGISG
jgi:hypothetical protein